MRIQTLCTLALLAFGCGDAGVGPDPTGTGGHSVTGTDASSTATGQGGASSSTSTDAAATTTTGQGGSSSSSGTGGNGQTMMGGWWESGTRLKAVSYAGADGSVVPAQSMRDTLLNADCYFGLAADGQMRCIPLATNVSMGSVFKDSGCSQPLAVKVCNTGAPAPFAYQSVTLGCQTGYRFFPVLAVYSGSLFTGSPANCNPTSAQPLFTYYDLGPEAPSSTFVAGTLTVEP
jgi:hypothetical protein